MVFGKKKEPLPPTMEEMERLKANIAYKDGVAPVQPTAVQSPMIHAEPTPFFVGRVVREHREKMQTLEDGQVIGTGQFEMIDSRRTEFGMTLDEVLDIVALCRGTTVGAKFRNLLMK